MTLFGDKIFTIRLQLRRIEQGDITLLARWSNDPGAYGACLTPEQASHQQLAELQAGGVYWGESHRMFLIELRDGSPIGTIRYWIQAEEAEHAVVALKIARPEERGKGYGTEAQKYLIMFLFDRTGVDAVEMYTDVNNHAQQRCLQKLGFDLIDACRYRDQQVLRTGYLYRLTRQQYSQTSIYQFHYA
jgi:RimJ/RimL family protein N-acetyltransferase